MRALGYSVALLVAAGLVGVGTRFSLGADVAAWVRAVGSVLAILVAIEVAAAQRRESARVQRLDKGAQLRAIAFLLEFVEIRLNEFQHSRSGGARQSLAVAALKLRDTMAPVMALRLDQRQQGPIMLEAITAQGYVRETEAHLEDVLNGRDIQDGDTVFAEMGERFAERARDIRAIAERIEAGRWRMGASGR